MKWSANLAWKVDLSETAAAQLAKLDQVEAKRILTFLRRRLVPIDDPRSIGKPLTGPLGGFWCYRVGDYRLISSILDGEVRILVVRLGHRSEVYRKQ
jgi:mRNA interferase RelE/StbE